MARDPWGGTLEITTMAADDHAEADEDLDQAALIRRRQQQEEDEATRRGWLLHAADEKKRKKRHVGRNTLLWTAGVVILVGSVATVARLVLRGPSPPPRHPDQYTQALHQALVFFNAQRSGPLPKDNGGVGWRGDSGMEDGLTSDRRRSLVGGYYDGGGTVKLSFPMAWSMTMLSWTVLEYGAKYDAVGELDHVKDLVRWGTDYLLRTFDSSAANHAIDHIIAQVGGSSECWMRPEDMDSNRPVSQCGACSDIAGEMAAALAAASIVFKDDDDGRYSEVLLHGAKVLYKFGTQQPGRYSGSELLYNSSGYQDELLWGGAWMYMATGNTSYVPTILPPPAGAPRVFSWDDKLPGSQLLLSRLRLLLSPGYPYEQLLSKFQAQNDNAMCSYLPVFKSFNFTTGGLIQLNHGRPRPLQYAVNAAFLASLYADYLDTAGTPGWNCGPDFYATQALRDFARSQLDYILGKNPLNMSYVVGFGNKYPKHVHHRGASIPYDGVKYGCKGGAEWRKSKKTNPNIIIGAMVAGPDRRDGFRDVRADYNYTEPSLAANAGLVAALISLAEIDTAGKSSGVDKNTIFRAIPPMFANPPPPPPVWEPTF